MMSKVVFHEKAFIPYFKQSPFEEIEAWGRALRANIPKTKKAILKAVPDNETYRKKIAQPLIVAVRKTLRDDFVNLKGLTKKQIISKMKAELKDPNAAKNFRKKVKRGYKNFNQGKLKSAMVARHLGNSFGPHRFRDAIELALGWLTPFIQPAKQGGFRTKFHNQVERSGKLITDLAYGPDIRKQENDIIHRLINEHLRKGLVPFSTGGQSHCDFILIKDSIVFYDSTQIKEIRYETYKEFISEKHANILRPLWRVIDESIPPNPDEYIGHPEKPAYFDMNLDIQVSKR